MIDDVIIPLLGVPWVDAHPVASWALAGGMAFVGAGIVVSLMLTDGQMVVWIWRRLRRRRG